MEKSIRLYDELHENARQPLSIDEANEEGCRFTDNEATLNAFEDFKGDYLSFCDEQNAIEGEPFAQEPPSIQTYLAQHKATRKASRKLKIGLTAPPVMDFSMRSKRVTLKAKTTRTQPVLRPVEKTEVQSTPKHVASAKTRPSLSFEEYVASSNEKGFLDAVFFLPKDCKEEMQNNPDVFVKQHAFANKGLVLNKIKLWIDKMSSDPGEANKLTITSMSGKKHCIGHIAFNFTSFKQYNKSREQIPFIKLMGNSKIKD
jgi:hypothetical protein